MYKEFETRTSYNYLEEVIKNLNEPICILGGWVVFFHVNKKFEKAQGRPYLGSRDIDLGFNISKDPTALSDTIKVLTGKLRFKPMSFRLVKEIHTETEEEIKDGVKIPAHFIFPMFVDLIVDSIPNDFKTRFGFDPIDEPILREVFEKKEYTILHEFGKNLLLPSAKMLLSMKSGSLHGRDKEHKKIKDICDIFALAWYSDLKLDEITPRKMNISDDEFLKAATQLGHDKEEVKSVIGRVTS